MELTRKQIYDMLWTDGVGKTEQALGLKHLELKEICETFDIPRPSSRYWTSLKLGRAAEKTALSTSKDASVMINTNDYIKKKRQRDKPTKVEPSKDAEGKYNTRVLPPE